MRKYSVYSPALILFTVLAFVFTSPARADDDPPGRVARLNFIQGSISFQPGGESDWVQASPNRPLTAGDNLWADRGSRGELHIGSTSIRVGGETGITFLNLDDRTVQIQLAQGSLNVNARRLDDGDGFEIDTPNLAFSLDRPGDYRVDVDPNGNATAITVRSGEGDAAGAGDSYHLSSGEAANFSGTDTLNYDGGPAGRLDDFDNWCRSRDEREERSQSARYVSRDVTGYDDLDDYGEWRSVPDYGYVWFPTRVDNGWAPYRNGHWAYVAPWGWTWVEDEPWGFAPFHYGRWAEFNNRWCWVPGPIVVRPVYAPALVVFVGGPRFGGSIAFGGGGEGVAWFPLGPREVYVPPYRVSERYVQRVNVTNTTVNVVNVTNVYNNREVNNVTYMHQRNVMAVTAVSHDTFVNARPVASANVRVNAQQMQTAQVQRNFTVAPVPRSVGGGGVPAAARPPAAVMSRQVVVKETPAPMRPGLNNPSFNRNAQQPERNFRQATAPPSQQQRGQPGQQPGQQMGQQPRPGQSPQQGQPPQPRQQMTNQPQQQQQQRQDRFPSRENQQQPVQQTPPAQQQPVQQTPPAQQQQPQMQQRQQNQFPSRQNQPQPIQPSPQPQHEQEQIQRQQPVPSQSQQQPQIQQHQQNQFPSRQNQPQPGQQNTPPPPPQQQTQPRVQTPPPPQQRPQINQSNTPPADQRPPAKFAPPAKTNEDTPRARQFERPQNAAPPAQATPPPPPREQQREQPKPQSRDQDNKKQGDSKDKK
ncbi:MAG TPA: DUF6600 domain-containing protein [Candidatus Acidoferrales bacterium]|nr:DUF6600 domain-containing protein [Candidatus Acidoferrales bacterium]